MKISANNAEIERFWANTDKRGDDECWPWTGGVARTGYGSLRINGVRWLANRLSLAIHAGGIEKSLCALHKCDNRICVNPSHLFEGTKGDNNRDRSAKGRTASGERHGSKTHPERLRRGANHPSRLNPSYLRRGDRHPHRQHPERLPHGEAHANARLTANLVRVMRAQRKMGISVTIIATEANVSRATAHAAIHGKTWRHVT